MIPNCTYTDASGVTTTPSEGVIFAYISESSSQIGYYDCVFYADVGKIYANEDASSMFSFFPALETIDLRMLDVSKVKNMYGMFSYCESLISLDISNFNTSNVTNMSGMFGYCSSLISLDLSSFNTSNVTDMTYMFSVCSSLTSLDLSSFDTSKVINMDSMLYECSSLTELNLSSFNTSKVTDMSDMFGYCSSLISLDLSNFKTGNVRDMQGMFSSCSSLTSLDLSNFDTSKVTRMPNMFERCSSLTSLDLSSFDMSNIEDDSNGDLSKLLEGCTSLEYLKSPKALPADSSINSKHAITLPTQFSKYCGVSSLTTSNLAENKVLDVVPGKFISEWKALREEGGDNGICAALTNGTEGNAKLTQLLAEYATFDAERKTKVDSAIDKEDVTIGESIEYFQNVIDGKQQISGNYNGIKDDTGSYMTISLTEESPYLIAIISLIGILSVVGYYFYNKKRQAM